MNLQKIRDKAQHQMRRKAGPVRRNYKEARVKVTWNKWNYGETEWMAQGSSESPSPGDMQGKSGRSCMRILYRGILQTLGQLVFVVPANPEASWVCAWYKTFTDQM